MSVVSAPTTGEIVRKASDAAFGQKLVVNYLRSIIVEAIVDSALNSDWTWCSTDWNGWDFEHQDSTRLEVKQSASRQSWATNREKPRQAQFDIAPRKGYWIGGSEWNPTLGRHAHIYVFAHHPVVDEIADHRDPSQWDFYVVPTLSLPDLRQIALSEVRRLATQLAFARLGAEVELVRTSFSVPRIRGVAR